MTFQSQGGSLLLTGEPIPSASSITNKETAHEEHDAGVTAMGLTVGPLDSRQVSHVTPTLSLVTLVGEMTGVVLAMIL
jgi:hypothetical protein